MLTRFPAVICFPICIRDVTKVTDILNTFFTQFNNSDFVQS